MKRFFGTYLSGFTGYKVKVTDVTEAGDKVMAALHDTASLGTAVVERDFAHVWTFRRASNLYLQPISQLVGDISRDAWWNKQP